MFIRKARESDIKGLSSLMHYLGYPTTEEQMKQRFKAISQQTNYAIFVAISETKVVGMVSVMMGLGVEQDGMYGRVIALVVNPESRKSGVGQQLMRAAEEWATVHGATSIVLNTGNRAERQAAHQFYIANGYEPKSTGFVKKID